jgi:hypothetical protein
MSPKQVMALWNEAIRNVESSPLIKIETGSVGQPVLVAATPKKAVEQLVANAIE